MKFKTFNARIKSEEGKADGGSIVAYASTFDREPDSYGDIVAKGAFTESLKKWAESGNPIPLLFGHRTDDPMMNIGGVTEAMEDEKGLKVTAEFDDENPNAQYCRKLVKEGRLVKLSFAYDVLDWAPVDLEDGSKANELRKLDIYEVSLVPIPANQNAGVLDVKAMGADGTDETDETGNTDTGDGHELANILGEIMKLAEKAVKLADEADGTDDDSEDEGKPSGDEQGPEGEDLMKSELLAYIEGL